MSGHVRLGSFLKSQVTTVRRLSVINRRFTNVRRSFTCQQHEWKNFTENSTLELVKVTRSTEGLPDTNIGNREGKSDFLKEVVKDIV